MRNDNLSKPYLSNCLISDHTKEADFLSEFKNYIFSIYLDHELVSNYFFKDFYLNFYLDFFKDILLIIVNFAAKFLF